MEFKDYYEVLGVARDADKDDIKRAYRKLARKYHPDVSTEADAEARFKEVSEAYEVLHDPEKRAAYDQLGENYRSGERFQPPPDWDQGFEFHGGGFTAGDAEQFSDFFEELFGRRGSFGAGPGYSGSHQFNMRGQDSYATIKISLEDAYEGASLTLTLQGADKPRTLNVKIPKGVKQGQHIRLAKQGGPGAGQGESGDLYLEVEFKPHAFYKVEGKDVYVNLPVAPWEAALGATIKAPTPSGVVDLKVPANSRAGRKLRLKGRGIPAKVPGDLYVVLDITLPSADSEESKAAYEAYRKAFDFNPRSELGV